MILNTVMFIVSYLMGSICSAIIVSQIFNLPDPREEGSKNPGATNVLRLAGKQYAAIVLLVDFIKGLLPVLLAHYLELTPQVVSFTVLAAVLGHVYPVFFGFQGGKGVATAIGALVGFNFIIGFITIMIWFLAVKLFHYSSLASLVSIILSPVLTLMLTHNISVFPALFFLVLLIIYKHKNNIARLIDGTEPKIFVKENIIKEIMEDDPKIDTGSLSIATTSSVIQSKVPAAKKRAPKKVASEKPVTTKEPQKRAPKKLDSSKK